MTDGCEGAEPGVDWLLAALQEFQQELREARDERVSSSPHFQFHIFHFLPRTPGRSTSHHRLAGELQKAAYLGQTNV